MSASPAEVAVEDAPCLSDLLDRVEQGERIIITRNGRPIARLIPVAAEPSTQP